MFLPTYQELIIEILRLEISIFYCLKSDHFGSIFKVIILCISDLFLFSIFSCCVIG
jgi:hypothetical protein